MQRSTQVNHVIAYTRFDIGHHRALMHLDTQARPSSHKGKPQASVYINTVYFAFHSSSATHVRATSIRSQASYPMLRANPGSSLHESNLSTIQNCFIQLSLHDLSRPALLQSKDMCNLSPLSFLSQHPFFMGPVQPCKTSRVASVPVHAGVNWPIVRSRTRTSGQAESWKTSSRPGAPRRRGTCRVRHKSWRAASSRAC